MAIATAKCLKMKIGLDYDNSMRNNYRCIRNIYRYYQRIVFVCDNIEPKPSKTDLSGGEDSWHVPLLFT